MAALLPRNGSRCALRPRTASTRRLFSLCGGRSTHALEDHQQGRQLDGLGQEVLGALLDRLHGEIDRAMPREHRDRNRGVDAAEPRATAFGEPCRRAGCGREPRRRVACCGRSPRRRRSRRPRPRWYPLAAQELALIPKRDGGLVVGHDEDAASTRRRSVMLPPPGGGPLITPHPRPDDSPRPPSPRCSSTMRCTIARPSPVPPRRRV